MGGRAHDPLRSVALASRLVSLAILLGLSLLLAYGCGGDRGGSQWTNPASRTATGAPGAPPPPPDLEEWSVRLGDAPVRPAFHRGFVDPKAKYHPSRILVKMKSPPREVGLRAAASVAATLAQRTGITMAAERHFQFIDVSVLQVRSKHTVPEAVAALCQQPDVEYAEPDYIRECSEVVPNDPQFHEQWALKNTGQSGGLVGADVDATFAWDRTMGNDSVVVAVIDTGVDYSHPDLRDRMWRNPDEIPGNGVDDDHNGYVDDIYGIDTVNNDVDPMDDRSHGTHCAGIIAASDNDIGVVGLAPGVRIMAVKAGGVDGKFTDSDQIEALDYAIQEGATLTSNSYGGTGYSASVYSSISRARAAGQVFVAAAGNESNNNDANSRYPAGYNLDNIISVGASTRTEGVATYSNYGASSVDLFAPGHEILSTLPGSQYGLSSGTSMAAPLVAGAAALVRSRNPGCTYLQVRNALLSTTDAIVAYQGKCVTGGRVNARRAVEWVAPSPSPSPSPSASPSPSPSPSPKPSPSPGPPPTGSISLQAGWNLVSFPVAELTGCYPEQGVSQMAFVWNPAQGAYEIVDLYIPSTVNTGEGTARGLWVFSERAASIPYAGRNNLGAGLDCYTDLRQGWNLVGAPFTPARPLSQVLVRWGTGFPQALPDSVCSAVPPTDPSCLLYEYGFSYSGGSYSPISLSDANADLPPNSAMWVYVHNDMTRLWFIPELGSLAVVSAPPGQVAAGGASFPVVIEARDPDGHRMAAFTGPIILKIKSFQGSPGAAQGTPVLDLDRPTEVTLMANAVEGRATFNLKPGYSGTYTLEASTTGASCNLGFTVVPGPLSGLAFVSSPVGGYIGDVLSPVELGFFDGCGNRLLDMPAPIAVATLSGSIQGQTSRAVDSSSGLAVFSDLRLSGAISESHQLQASGGGLSALSKVFPQRLPQLQSGEFLINSTTANRQEGPDVSWNPASREFFVVWASIQKEPISQQDVWGIYGKRFNASGGALTGEFPIFVGDATSIHREPEVACAPDGTVTVVWQGRGSAWGIYGRRFAKDGTALGPEALLGSGEDPEVAMAGDGSASVVWTRTLQSGASEGIYYRQWASDGKMGSVLQANSGTAGDERWPCVGADGAGNRVIVWHRSTLKQLFGLRMGAGEQAPATRFSISPGRYPALAMACDGRFHLVWDAGSALYDGSGSVIGPGVGPPGVLLATSMNDYGTICSAGNSDAANNTADVYVATAPGGYTGRVSQYPTENQWVPSVALSPEGILMVVWQSNLQDGSLHGVYGRVFAP